MTRHMRTSLRRAVLATTVAAIALGLAACGTESDQAQGLRNIAEIWKTSRIKRDEEKATPEQIQRGLIAAMQSVPGPLMVAVVTNTDATSVLGVPEANGAYRTWRTPSDQTITFKHGVLTGTRGLGFDLLSSQADPAINLIVARRAGTVTRVYGHINGVNHEVPMTVTCKITPEAADSVVLPTGARIAATRVSESCRNDDVSFKNLYWVTGSGEIVQSSQWVSVEVGSIVLQTLRS